MKITGKKKFFLALVAMGIISGCAGTSTRIDSGYDLAPPYEVTLIMESGFMSPEKLVGFTSPGKGYFREFDVEDWRLKTRSTEKIPPGGTLTIEDRGQLFGHIAAGGVWIALKGKEIYNLIFSSDCQYKLPPEDIKDDGSFILHNDEYFVKGYKGKLISSHFGVPILSVNYFERIKEEKGTKPFKISCEEDCKKMFKKGQLREGVTVEECIKILCK